MKKLKLLENLNLVKKGSIITLKNELNDIRKTVDFYDENENKIVMTDESMIMVDYITIDANFMIEVE